MNQRNRELRNAYQKKLMTERKIRELERTGKGTALQMAKLLERLEKQRQQHTELKYKNKEKNE